MILYCAIINFYQEISDPKNLTPWLSIFKSLDHPTISFFMPNQLRRTFITKFLGNENNKKAPGLCLLSSSSFDGLARAVAWRERARPMKIDELLSPRKTRRSKITLRRMRASTKPPTTWVSAIPRFGPLCAKASRSQVESLHALKVNHLTESNMSNCVAHWLLSQPDSLEQKVCWSDEKWFVLQPLPSSWKDWRQLLKTSRARPPSTWSARQSQMFGKDIKRTSRQKRTTSKPSSNSYRNFILSLYISMFINSFSWSFWISI